MSGLILSNVQAQEFESEVIGNDFSTTVRKYWGDLGNGNRATFYKDGSVAVYKEVGYENVSSEIYKDFQEFQEVYTFLL